MLTTFKSSKLASSSSLCNHMSSFQRISPLALRVAAALVLPMHAQSFSHFHVSAKAPFPKPTRPNSSGRDRFFDQFFASPSDDDDSTDTPPTLETLALDLANGKFQNIVVLVGAGMSTSAGIADFRTPGTGLYSKLEEYNLPYPEAIFELSYFKQNPAPFVDVAKAIWPGQADGPKPTLAHSFVALLERQGYLKRVYTQNIDGLERLAGVSADKLIECHGHFSTCSCIKFTCRRKRDAELIDECRESYSKGQVLECPDCGPGSKVKPDIVFFGEEMPSIFMDNIDKDMDDCDLLLVIGTSLLVAPVSSIPNWVGEKVPRILINRDLVGSFGTEARRAGQNENYQTRDVWHEGDCDEGAQKLCELAGQHWVKQLEELHAKSKSN